VEILRDEKGWKAKEQAKLTDWTKSRARGSCSPKGLAQEMDEGAGAGPEGSPLTSGGGMKSVSRKTTAWKTIVYARSEQSAGTHALKNAGRKGVRQPEYLGP